MHSQDVTGIFRNRKKARKAVMHLIEAGVPREDIHIVQSDDDYGENMQFKVQSRFSIVAVISSALGGVVGSLSTNIVEISPLAAAVLGISLGTMIGSIIGSLVGAELTERESHEIAANDKNGYILQVTSHGYNDRNIGRMLKKDGAIRVKNAA